MTLRSVFLGFLLTAVAIAPIYAIETTASDHGSAVALLLLWLVIIMRGFGYDLVEHVYGAEIGVYVMALVLIHTFGLIDTDVHSLEVWLVVVVLEVVYQVLRLFPSFYRYIDEYGYSEHELEQVKLQEAQKHWYSSSPELLHPLSWREYTALCSAFLAGVVPLCAYRYTTLLVAGESPTSLANLPLLVSWLEAPLLLLIVFRHQIRAKTVEEDFWIDYGNLYVLCALLDVARIPALDWVGTVIVLVEFVLVLVVLTAAHHKANNVHSVGWGAYFFISLNDFVGTVLHTVLFDTIGTQIVYVLCNLYVMYVSDSVMYNSHVSFGYVIEDATCAVLDVVNNYIAPGFEALDGETIPGGSTNPLAIDAWEFFLDSFGMALESILNMIRLWMVAVYPFIADACHGYSDAMAPTGNLLVLAGVVVGVFPTIFVLLQGFPEAKKLVRGTTFWAVAAMLSLFTVLVIQLCGDPEVYIWSIFVFCVYTRNYTTIGVVTVVVQVAVVVVCALEVFDRLMEERERKLVADHPLIDTSQRISQTPTSQRVSRTAAKPAMSFKMPKMGGGISLGEGVSLNLRDLPLGTMFSLLIQTLTKPFQKPMPYFFLIGFVLLTYALETNFIIQDIQIEHYVNPNVPAWLTYVQKTSGFSAVESSLAALVGTQVQLILAFISLVEQLVQALGGIVSGHFGFCGKCWSLGALCGIIPSDACVYVDFATFVGEVVGYINDLIELVVNLAIEGVIFLVSEAGSAAEVVDVVLQNLGDLADFQFFDLLAIPGIRLPGITFPLWLSYLLYGIILLVVVVAFFLTFSSDVMVDLVMRAALGLVWEFGFVAYLIYYAVITNLTAYQLEIVVTWTSDPSLYIAAAVCFLSGVAFTFTGDETVYELSEDNMRELERLAGVIKKQAGQAAEDKRLPGSLGGLFDTASKPGGLRGLLDSKPGGLRGLLHSKPGGYQSASRAQRR